MNQKYDNLSMQNLDYAVSKTDTCKYFVTDKSRKSSLINLGMDNYGQMISWKNKMKIPNL